MTKPIDLYRLQQVETELDEKRKRLEQVEDQLEDSAVVTKAADALGHAEEQLQGKAAEQRDLELELKSLSQKAAGAEERLYSGAVTSPKELADLQAEVKSLGRRRQALEDGLLEAMIELEEAEEAVSSARARLEATQGEWSGQQSDLAAEQAHLRAELAKLEKERDRLLPRIGEEDLATFRSLWKRKGGLAVARVEDGTCGGCGVAIAPKTEWRLRHGELACCSNCDRILVRI
jgi:predicted  nucleic acid-binding Zn-ribbon protein